MSLLKRIDEDLIKALKSGDRDTATTLRGLKSDIKYFQINNRIKEVTDEEITTVLTAAAKQRRDSIEQFTAGNRNDLVAKESAELDLITGYLPAPLTPEELEAVVREAIDEAGVSSPSDMGAVMKLVIPRVKGRADGKVVKETVVRHLRGD